MFFFRLASHRFVATGVSLLTGAVTGMILHHLIYRLSLPAKPFVYAAF